MQLYGNAVNSVIRLRCGCGPCGYAADAVYTVMFKIRFIGNAADAVYSMKLYGRALDVVYTVPM
jgi:hypothetical protein